MQFDFDTRRFRAAIVNEGFINPRQVITWITFHPRDSNLANNLSLFTLFSQTSYLVSVIFKIINYLDKQIGNVESIRNCFSTFIKLQSTRATNIYFEISWARWFFDRRKMNFQNKFRIKSLLLGDVIYLKFVWFLKLTIISMKLEIFITFPLSLTASNKYLFRW